MDEEVDPLTFDPTARAEWVHSLRNAVNNLGMAVMLAQRYLEKERAEEAMGALAHGMKGWERCQALLEHTTAATQLPLEFGGNDLAASDRHTPPR